MFLQHVGLCGRLGQGALSAASHPVATTTIRIGAQSRWRLDARGRSLPDAAAELREAVAPLGLACISGWHSAQLLARDAEAEIAALRPCLDLMHALGSSVLVFADTTHAIHHDVGKPLSKRPSLRPGAWASFGARLTRVADAVAAEGVSLAYHHHLGTIVQSPDDIASLMANTGPSVKLLLDTGHAAWAGADPVELARVHAARIVQIHASDIRADTLRRAQDWSYQRAVVEGAFTVPGDGVVDFGRVFARLPRFEGWVVVETRPDTRTDPVDQARLGELHLRRVLADTGHLRLEMAA